jgi:hypothetical protein
MRLPHQCPILIAPEGELLMLCHDLAEALSRYGIHVAFTFDGDDAEDGDLLVSAGVHVQVPTFGEPPRVVLDGCHGDLRCYPPRQSVAELAADIRTALDEVPAVYSSSSVN